MDKKSKINPLKAEMLTLCKRRLMGIRHSQGSFIDLVIAVIVVGIGMGYYDKIYDRLKRNLVRVIFPSDASPSIIAKGNMFTITCL